MPQLWDEKRCLLAQSSGEAISHVAEDADLPADAVVCSARSRQYCSQRHDCLQGADMDNQGQHSSSSIRLGC